MTSIRASRHLPLSSRLQYQLIALVAVHVLSYKLLNRFATGQFRAKSDVFAHYVPFLVCFVGMAAYGDYLWLYDEGVATLDKTWGSHDGARAASWPVRVARGGAAAALM